MEPFKNFYTPLSGAPKKCVKSGPALANAGPAYEYAVSVTRHILMGANFAPLGVIAIQYLLLMFDECMQTLFLRRWQETKSKRTHTAFLKIFTMVNEQKDENALEIGYQHFKGSPNFSIFVVKYQSFTKFSIRWLISRYIL